MTKTTSTLDHEAQPKLTHADLRKFTGDVVRFAHPLNPKVVYSPGVRHVAQVGQAYWLIDAIASYFGSEQMNAAIKRDARLGSLHFWRLDVQDGGAVLTASADACVKPFIRQEIPYTDFPLDYIDIWAGFDGSHWTLYLPSEH